MCEPRYEASSSEAKTCSACALMHAKQAALIADLETALAHFESEENEWDAKKARDDIAAAKSPARLLHKKG